MKENKQLAKMLPHSLEAEEAVLGCMLIDGDVPLAVTALLKSEDFYMESHKAIFEAMVEIYESNRPIDFVTLTDTLEKNNTLESVGGIDYITALTNVVPSASNYNHYVAIVKRDSVLRTLISSGQKIIDNSFESDDKEDAIAFAEKQIFEISKNEETSKLEHIGESINAVFEKFNQIAKDGGVIRGIPTGFSEFDQITNGLQNSDLILLAARPGVGKTSFAMQIINYAAIVGKKKCAIFSLEMPKIQIAQRSLCSVACVSMENALKGKLSTEEWKALLSASKKFSDAGVYIDDSSMNTPSDILSKCRRLQREQGLDLIMIDYLQLMNSGKKSRDANRTQEISEMTRMLKIAAKELNVPIILLSQLSRAVETRQDHHPMLSDLRESGSIEQDADIVLFIYKPENYGDVDTSENPGACELIVAKHRNGRIGSIKLRWVGAYVSFIDYDKSPSKLGGIIVAPNELGEDELDADELLKAYSFDEPSDEK